MSQNPHIFFTAGCWRKHLLMQISKFACFDCYTLKCEAWRTPCAIYYVHNMAHGTASQLWWWSTIWNDDRNQRKQNHIISYHTMPTILLCIYKNISDIFSCNFTKQRRKKAMLCKFQWKEEKNSVYHPNHNSFTGEIANKSACSGFKSWMKTESTKNGGGLRARLERIQNEWKLNGGVWNQQTGFQVLATSTQAFLFFKKKQSISCFCCFFLVFATTDFF